MSRFNFNSKNDYFISNCFVYIKKVLSIQRIEKKNTYQVKSRFNVKLHAG